MAELSEVVAAIEQQDPVASERLLPGVYEELRRLAAQRLAGETSSISLDASDLVHETYLRLKPDGRHWDSPGHFFATAADEMRRILIDRARRKRRSKHGGDRKHVELPDLGALRKLSLDDMLALHDALDALQQESAIKAELVKLRYFVGLSLEESAVLLEISRATASRHWTYSRAWLFDRLKSDSI